MSSTDYNFQQSLTVSGKTYHYYSLAKAQEIGSIKELPYSLKILIENLLRHQNDTNAAIRDIKAIIDSVHCSAPKSDISFMPARILMQDFTGVPAIVDLAAMRDAMAQQGGDPMQVNPLIPVDLVIDHSVMVDHFGTSDSFHKNVEREYERNNERYDFLKWGQKAFKNFRAVPPGTGICHQVNLEYLAQVVWTKNDGDKTWAYPDTVFGTDSHTTMVNGLSVLGWGVGGIEAEAAMLGQSISMLIPDVVGFKLIGALCEGITATDLVLTITNILRSKGVVGKFVEFYGSGLDHLTLADRATISNMAPEYGATCGFFPIDNETIRYLNLTGRHADQIALVEAYAKAQGLWRTKDSADPIFSNIVELDLSSIEPSMAGPKRPQDRILLSKVKETSNHINDRSSVVGNGDVVIAAITSCTNTSNPAVMIGAGILARKALALGLKSKPWVKTSLAPGSQVVTEYLEQSGLMTDLNAFGFNLVGYGCATCIGNSGPLAPEVTKAIEDNKLVVAGVLSGNRNFEGRIHPHVKDNYLASPPLVVAYAIAGSISIDLTSEPLGTDKHDNFVYLRDIWPKNSEIQEIMDQFLKPEVFAKRYKNVFEGDDSWSKNRAKEGVTYEWNEKSTYIKRPPYFQNFTPHKQNSVDDITGAKILAILGDSVTTDHISPAGNIKATGSAGLYLNSLSVSAEDFNSYGARRGNHEVMVRGTFANIRLKNEMVPDEVGGMTRYFNSKDSQVLPIYDAAQLYSKQKTPLVVFAGLEYGTGSSRDWAAKGTMLLGVKAVIAESFERIHRSNLIGMGVIPLVFTNGETRHSLKLIGNESIDILGLAQGIEPGMQVTCKVTRANGEVESFILKSRIDTQNEADYYLNGGILNYVLKEMIS